MNELERARAKAVLEEIAAGNPEDAEVKVFWRIIAHAPNDQIVIEKEVTLWERRRGAPWRRLLRQVIPLAYSVVTLNEANEIIRPAVPDDVVSQNNNLIHFHGGFLQVIDPGLIDALRNWNITLDSEESLSEFVISRSSQFKQLCDNKINQDQDNNESLFSIESIIGTIRNIIPGSSLQYQAAMLTKASSHPLESLLFLGMLPSLIPGINNQLCGNESLISVGENIRIDTNISTVDEACNSLSPVIYFPQNDNFTAQLIEMKKELDTVHNGNLFLFVLSKFEEFIDSGDFSFDNIIACLQEIYLMWLAYKFEGRDLGTIALDEWIDEDGNRSIRWQVSNLPMADSLPDWGYSKPFILNGIHKITVNEDQNQTQEENDDCADTYFECLVDAIPIHTYWPSDGGENLENDETERNEFSFIGHNFGNGARTFFIGYNPKDETRFEGAIKNIDFDPSSGCGGCY